MKKILPLILALMMIFCLLSCRQASTVVESPNQPWAGSLLPNYASRFDYFWRAINSHYVFWDVDPTDWDAVYNTYLPKFKELDNNVGAASAEKREEVAKAAFESATAYYKDLTKTLIDHHLYYMVFDPYMSGINVGYSPSELEAMTRDYYHPSFTKVEVKPDLKLRDWTEGVEMVNYFAQGGAGSPADGYKTVANLMSSEDLAVLYFEKYNPETGEGKAIKDGVVSKYCIAYDFTVGKLNSDGSDMHVIYLAMSEYYAEEWLDAYSNSPAVCPADKEEAFKWKAGKTLFTFFAAVKAYFDKGSLAGLIMDNRNNIGGYNSDLNYFLGLYTDAPVTVAYSKYKEGFGKTDYSSEVPYTFTPITDSPYYCDLVTADIPYVVLCDLNSISNGEITTAGISSMKNGYVIGERTFGGTGPLIGEPSYLPCTYGGSFGDEKNGPVYCYTSTWNNRTFTRNGYKNLEGKGVTPDKEIYFKSTGEGNLVKDVQTMLKTQIKEAFSYISKY